MNKNLRIIFSVLCICGITATAEVVEAQQAPGNSTMVTFIKKDDDSWPLEWHVTLPTGISAQNGFEIRSNLKTDAPPALDKSNGYDKDILGMVLVKNDEIQKNPGDPVNITFRLNPAHKSNPYNPLMEVGAGFSRTGSFKGDASNPITVSAYGTSGPLKMLGTSLADLQVAKETDFSNGRILFATLKTSDAKNTYVYEVFLKEIPAGAHQ